jgi:hypothetical protein
MKEQIASQGISITYEISIRGEHLDPVGVTPDRLFHTAHSLDLVKHTMNCDKILGPEPENKQVYLNSSQTSFGTFPDV